MTHQNADAKNGAWTAERIRSVIENNSYQLRKAILAVRSWKPADQAYMTYMVGWLEGGKNRVPLGDHHGRCLVVMRSYLFQLAVGLNERLQKAS